MEKFIKRVAIATLTGILAFAVIPATVQAAGWKQNKNGYWWQEMITVIRKNNWKKTCSNFKRKNNPLKARFFKRAFSF